MGPQSNGNISLNNINTSTVNNTNITVNNAQLRCIYLNADQLNNKFSELELLVSTEKYDLIMINEVKPKNSRFTPISAEYNINNYNLFSINIENKIGRGCLLYAIKTLDVREINLNIPCTEYILIELLNIKREKIILGCVYRSPYSSFENNNCINNLIKELCKTNYKNIILVGDFNYGHINWSDYTSRVQIEQKFAETLQDNYLMQLIKKPTRKRGTNKESLLDLIITLDSEMINNITHLSPLGCSDHSIISFNICINPQKIKREKLIYFYNKGHYVNMCKYVSNQDLKHSVMNNTNNIDNQWDNFEKIILIAKEQCIPCKLVLLGEDKQWTMSRTNEMKQIGNKRDRQWTRYMESGNVKHYKEFTKHRNKIKSLSRKNRRAFENNLASSAKTNPKAIWKYINNRLNINKEISEVHIHHSDTDSILIDNQTIIVDIFSDYFNSVFTKDDNDITYPSINILPCNYPMQDIIITENLVSEHIKKLDVNKSEGSDGINARILYELHDVILTPLTMIFNNSLKLESVPKNWKKAHVAPIHKKGNRKLVSNYRPVSLTSITCKLMEKIISCYINRHIIVNNYFSISQHGFIKGRSTTTQLLEIMDQWTTVFDNYKQLDCVYLDFRKAFDTVSHKLLIHKLKMYNLPKSLLSWLYSFISNRKQAVKICGKLSKWTNVESGVPQGSILGPLLFLLFINDIPSIVNSNIMLFADDTKIWREINCSNDYIQLQNDIYKILEWCSMWHLHLNIDKCKCMSICANECVIHDYEMNNSLIVRTEFEKDVGIVFDSSLEFDRHITEKCNKANSIFGLLRRTFKFLDEKNFMPLYKTMSRCHLDYGIVIWNPYKEKYNDQIEKVQRRATKVLPGFQNYSYIDRLQKLKLPCLKFRRLRGDLIEVYKLFNGNYDKNILKNLLKPKLKTTQRHSLRGHDFMLKTQSFNTKYRKYFFSVRVTNWWNSLPQYVVNAKSVNAFKNKLDGFCINKRIYYDHKYRPETTLINQLYV